MGAHACTVNTICVYWDTKHDIAVLNAQPVKIIAGTVKIISMENIILSTEMKQKWFVEKYS
jgi:hypothetical protein